MQQFLKVMGYVALAIAGLYLATVVLDTFGDVSRGLYFWSRYRLLPGLIWAGGIGIVLYGLYVFFTGQD